MKALFKQIGAAKLFLETYYPGHVETGKTYPAMVFFFGGGWIGGDRGHFVNHARYFSRRGIVCFLVDYRTNNNNNNKTTPFESLKDAKSAIRFIRKNALLFNIDPTNIIASGGSAGGHLAAATALIEDYNEDSDDLSFSCAPNALALFNPVTIMVLGAMVTNELAMILSIIHPCTTSKKERHPPSYFLGQMKS